MSQQKTLLIIYYVCLALIVAAIVGGRYLAFNFGIHTDPQTQTGIAFTSICIIYTLAATFIAFWGFNYLLKSKKKALGINQAIDDEQRPSKQDTEALKQYHFKLSIARIAIITSAVVLCVMAFFITIHKPMMWCAAIPLLMLTICKPSQQRYLQETEG